MDIRHPHQNFGHYIGTLGEGIVCRYLVGKGYRLIERNYAKKAGEIDIIAEKGRDLHFIEVKSTSSYGDLCTAVEGYNPSERVDRRKLLKLSRIIEIYLSKHAILHTQNWYIDVYIVYVDIPHRKATVRSIENVILDSR